VTRHLPEELRLDKPLAGWSASTPDEVCFLSQPFAYDQEAIRVRLSQVMSSIWLNPLLQ
jgi:hypothetical protein